MRLSSSQMADIPPRSPYTLLPIMTRDSDDQDLLLEDKMEIIGTPARQRDTRWRSILPKYMLLFQTLLLTLNVFLFFWSISGSQHYEPQLCQVVEEDGPACELSPGCNPRLSRPS